MGSDKGTITKWHGAASFTKGLLPEQTTKQNKTRHTRVIQVIIDHNSDGDVKEIKMEILLEIEKKIYI